MVQKLKRESRGFPAEYLSSHSLIINLATSLFTTAYLPLGFQVSFFVLFLLFIVVISVLLFCFYYLLLLFDLFLFFLILYCFYYAVDSAEAVPM